MERLSNTTAFKDRNLRLQGADIANQRGWSDLADASMRLARSPTRMKRLLLYLPKASYSVILIDPGKGLDPLAISALLQRMKLSFWYRQTSWSWMP